MNDFTFFSWTVLLSLLLTLNVNADEYWVEITGDENPCPQNSTNYIASGYHKADNGYVTTVFFNTTDWTHSGGVSDIGGGDGYSFISITWDDKDSVNIFIECIVDKVGGASGTTTAYGALTVKPMSLNGYTPSSIIGSYNIDYGNVLNETYSINPILYPDGSSINSYMWIIPSGWTHGGVTSNGSTPFLTSSPSISVTTDKGCSGSSVISVFGINNQCSNLSTSIVSELTITRDWPSTIVTGPKTYCTTGTYTLNELNSNILINWTHSSNMSLASSQGSNPATFSRISDSDVAWVKATLTINGCTSLTTDKFKTVNVGVPNSNNIDISLDDGDLWACDYTIGEADYNGTAGITAYEWDMPNASDWDIDEDTGAGFDMQHVEIDYWEDPAPSTETIRVRAKNICPGWSEWKSETFDVIDNCGGYYMMVISPNPADTYVELNFIEDSSSTLEEGVKQNKIKFKKKNKNGEIKDFLVQILDKYAVVRKSEQTNKLKVNIPTNDLEPGTFFIHVTIEEKTYKQQLIIK